LMDERLDRLSHHLTREGGQAGAQPPEPAKVTLAAFCESGQLRRGYQVFGPEGWRTFDQDERLVLAMSSSGQPLIETLRELSDRVLKQQDPGTAPIRALLEEQLRTRRAQKALAEGAGKGSIDAALIEFGK